MVYNSAFDIKLAEGEERENAFASLFSAGTTFEVKSDVMSRQTGNVFIEFAQGIDRHPSGIAITKSEYYAIETFRDRWIVIKTDDLKELCRRIYDERRKHDRKYRGTKGGDNNNWGVLVPMSEFYRHFQLVRR